MPILECKVNGHDYDPTRILGFGKDMILLSCRNGCGFTQWFKLVAIDPSAKEPTHD